MSGAHVNASTSLRTSHSSLAASKVDLIVTPAVT
jgi:hypothetical protein